MAFERILVSNDDGLHAPGLAALVASLSSVAEVYVVAPDQERSGVGHGFTLHDALRADPHPNRFAEGLAKATYSCSGLPADCVKIALLELMKDVGIDLLVSGVNRGANMGSDVFYSGTVAAAREGLLNGVPALATSLVLRGPSVEETRHPHFSTASDWAVRILQEQEAVLRRGLEEGFFLNLNVANVGAESVAGWEWTDVADTRYHDGYVRHEDPTGRPHFWLEGELDLRDLRPFCDVAVVREKKVSLSPISIEPGARQVLAELRDQA